jgi:hypothetical protein
VVSLAIAGHLLLPALAVVVEPVASGLLRWLVGKPEGRPLGRGEHWIAALTERRLSRVEQEKKFIEIGAS